ncbi:MAG: 3'(2'),5'-bisphosphate nucleotidase CysQ [Actinobacteria bacterium]|nr:3'(2'),5'-bisphosphate nucleotidase CysQ [Actinomycetota bacterium]NBQ45070.1 3'(2'),5'-bisphosphate nucleotidase CysQ [Actinomycetota bacterium]NDE70650.1 3'(2'),5'-bisphosphate nucleotidase CysQ [Actinomycetota bacterium]NDF84420.1 3'(2'),5'-bisphosphate nucleotidase CysQ [Actinomycetota bacterium]
MNSLNDHEFAAYLATETGKRLVALRNSLVERGVWGWDLKDAGDAMAQEFLMSQLREFRPDDAVLSEEAVDNAKRLTADRVWIIDPLDGTQEFSEPDRSDWAVHVALWQRDKNDGSHATANRSTNRGSLVAAAVGLPAIELTLGTNPPPAQPKNYDGPPRLVVSRTRTPREAIIVAEALGCDAMRLGSAGAKAMSVVLGECDIYLHTGGQHQWDSAAPVAVARAAGLHTSRIDGSPLIYNEQDTWLPDLIVCRSEFAKPVLAALGHKS